MPSALFNVAIHIFFHSGKTKVETADPLRCVFSLPYSAISSYLWYSFAEQGAFSNLHIDLQKRFHQTDSPFLLETRLPYISQPSLQLGVIMRLISDQWNVEVSD